MEFSVVIPTFNRSGTLALTLAALAAQEFGTDSPEASGFEVIVVDDGSSDDTAAVVARISKGFPVPLQYLYQDNRKQGAARNLGAQRATGSYLVFLGDDTVPRRDFLAEHRLSHRNADPKTAVIGYTPWADDSSKSRFMEYIGEKGWQFGFSLIEDPQRVPFNFFYTSNLSLSRALFLASGGFDEEFQEYGWEDTELSLRLHGLGMRIVYNRRAVADHHHPTSVASFVRRQRKVGYSAWTFYRKHPEMASFLNVHRVPRYGWSERLRMAVLTRLCCWTERMRWPDLSGYYPDLMSYHYNRGILDARK